MCWMCHSSSLSFADLILFATTVMALKASTVTCSCQKVYIQIDHIHPASETTKLPLLRVCTLYSAVNRSVSLLCYTWLLFVLLCSPSSHVSHYKICGHSKWGGEPRLWWSGGTQVHTHLTHTHTQTHHSTKVWSTNVFSCFSTEHYKRGNNVIAI